MVYSYDRNIQMPTKDLYDTQIMAMALNVAKDEYEKAEKRLDDLNKLYGDFYSPSDADMQNWQTRVVDPIKNQLDDLYARGMDPARSAEGQAILARVSRNLPYDDINKLKQSAAVMQENIKNARELLAKGLYDPEYAKFLKQDPKTWDTLKQGVFQYSSPTALPTWHDTVSPYYDKRTAMPLTQEEMAAEGYQFDPMKNYTGYIQKHIEQVADANLPAYLRTPEGQYRQYQAKQQLATLSGRSPEEVSDAEANAEVKRSWMGAGQEWLIGPEGVLDPRALDDYRTANDIKAHRQKAAITAYYSNSGGGNGSGSYTEAPYSTKVRMFNEGLANLLGVSVDVVNDVAKRGDFVYNRAVENQTALVDKYKNTDDLISAISSYTPYSRQLIANVLELNQVNDDDKQNNIYTIDKHELKNIVDASYIVSKIKTSDPLDTGVNDLNTKAIRNRYKNTYRSDMKVDPTGRVITYLDKDGTIKKYAELEIVGGGSGSGETVYADLGNNSTKIDGSNIPVGINYNSSTLRDRGYEIEDKKMSSDQTKSIKTSWNR